MLSRWPQCQAGVLTPAEGSCQAGRGAGRAAGTGLQRVQEDLPQKSIPLVTVIDPVKRRY